MRAIQTEVDDLITAIKPLLAGKAPELQGAALVGLTAIWLWGHQGEQRDRLRQDMLDLQNKAIRKLVELFDTAGRPV